MKIKKRREKKQPNLKGNLHLIIQNSPKVRIKVNALLDVFTFFPKMPAPILKYSRYNQV